MNTRELQDEIIKLKKEKDVCILAHAYQSPDIIDVADYTGDSYALSKLAATAPQKTIIMCGVRFMADTVKILSPEKKVFIANEDALCPMADQLNIEDLRYLKKAHPDHIVCAYINTTTAIKTEVDLVVTSSSAKKILENTEEKNILFVPDQNLGTWLKKQLPQKNMVVYPGGCPTHMRLRKEHILRMKEKHPNAKVLVHPECLQEVSKIADYVGSTTGIMNYAKESNDTEFIIGTENSIVTHLQMACPDKMFYTVSKHCICHNMKATTLTDVYNTLRGRGGKVILLDEETIKKARKPIDEMIKRGG